MKTKNRWHMLRWIGIVVGFLVAVTGARATVEATGGDYTYDKMIDGSRYRLHVFTNAGPAAFTVTQGGEVEYLVVGAGGGGGGFARSGGGGAGGGGGGAVLSNVGSEKLIVSPQAYDVHVGTGLAAQVGQGGKGASSFFASIEAPGGGGGGSERGATSLIGGDGSSGGGGAGASYVDDYFKGLAGKGTAGLGYDGGNGNWTDLKYSGGGGGGAAAPGLAGTPDLGGDGGQGVSNLITGVAQWYGGGGGGSCMRGTAGVGGLGGGAPGRTTIGNGAHAVPNTGGGGGGGLGDGSSPLGGRGGSGLVIVRYIVPRAVYAEATGGDYTYEKIIGDARYRIHVFTNTGSSTLTVTESGEVEYLVVGGGGAGGGFAGATACGGGGGGAVLSNVGGEKMLVFPKTYAITVGRGGAITNRAGGPGGASVLDYLVAPGGGGGGSGRAADDFNGRDGSSGGGGSGATHIEYYYGTGGKGMAGFGYGGGDGNWTNVTYSGGGGGGAGAPGDVGVPNAAGDGGQGVSNLITGDVQWLGGGGGGSCPGGTAGLGGLGGGAPGLSSGNGGNPAVSNTGGGGGAGLGNGLGSFGGPGGSGIVVVRYQIKPRGTILMIQ